MAGLNLDLELEIAIATAKAKGAKPQDRALGTFNDGTIYEKADGSRYFKSPGYATTDPEVIAGMMDGMTPAETGQSQIDRQRIAENPVAARALKFNEGAPFVGSWLDEAVGVVSPDAAENMRRTSASMDRENPGESAALRVAGTVGYGLPMLAAGAPAMQQTTTGGQAIVGGIAGGVAGGIEGAVYGAGQQEGGRGANAAQNAIWGTGTGVAAGLAAPYVVKGVKSLLTSLKGSDVSVLTRELGISPAAARVVRQALDVGDMDEAMRALQRAGDDAMLADAGQPAAELLDAAAASGGRAGKIARDAVDSRVTRASGRVNDALDDTLGPVGQGIETAKREVRQGTAAARKSVYDAAYAKPINYAGTRGQQIETLLDRVPQSAVSRANELMRLDGVESAQIMAQIGDDGAVTFTKMPDVRQIDYITRALGDVADNADGAGKMGGTTQLGRSYRNLQTSLRKTLRNEVPEYGKALDTAADAISRTRATDFGSTLLRDGTSREAVRDALRGASKAERDAMKAGVRQAVDDQVANVKRAITDGNMDAREAVKVLRQFSSRAAKDKLQMLVGSQEAAKLLDELDEATVAFELRAAIATNSKTAIRGAIQQGVRDQTAPGLVEQLSAGEPINATKRFVQVFTGNSAEAQQLRQMGVFEEIADALTSIKGRKAEQALRVVYRAIEGQRITDQQAAFVGRVVAASTALPASREASRRLAR